MFATLTRLNRRKHKALCQVAHHCRLEGRSILHRELPAASPLLLGLLRFSFPTKTTPLFFIFFSKNLNKPRSGTLNKSRSEQSSISHTPSIVKPIFFQLVLLFWLDFDSWRLNLVLNLSLKMGMWDGLSFCSTLWYEGWESCR